MIFGRPESIAEIQVSYDTERIKINCGSDIFFKFTSFASVHHYKVTQ
jgi:hypothetical protein